MFAAMLEGMAGVGSEMPGEAEGWRWRLKFHLWLSAWVAKLVSKLQCCLLGSFVTGGGWRVAVFSGRMAPGGWLREDRPKNSLFGNPLLRKTLPTFREDGSGRISQKMVSLGTLYCEKRYRNAPGGWLREDGYPPKGLLTATIWLRRQPRPQRSSSSNAPGNT